MISKLVRTGLVCLWLLPALAVAEEPIRRPHIDQTEGASSVMLRGRTFTSQGLVGAGSLPAGTVDFLGDTLGSFSSLQIALGSWKRMGDHYEGILWTLPDRGRNDPEARIFFDYAGRLHRFRISFAPNSGKVEIVPDGGLMLRDFGGQPFTGADPSDATVIQNGYVLPSPAAGPGKGKISLDAEALQFRADGSFYVGDEYTANVYYFGKDGRLKGIIVPPAAVTPRREGKHAFGSLNAPETGRRNNQGAEGMSLSPDGRMLFVALQSALMQDTASGNGAGRTNTRVLVYDVSQTATPAQPVAHYVVQLPVYSSNGDGGAPDKTAAQSEIRALDDHSFLILSRDGAGLGAEGDAPIVYKSILLVDVSAATNLAGTAYEGDAKSLLQDKSSTSLVKDIVPAQQVELVNMLNPVQLQRFGLSLDGLSEKWEAMDLVSVLAADRPADYYLFVGNDNDFTARSCRMTNEACNSKIDNDNRILIYRLRLAEPLQATKPSPIGN